MKYIPLVGIGLVIWGAITLDWFKAGIGLILFFGAFLIDLYKKRNVIANDDTFTLYHSVTELIKIIRASVESSELDINNPKVILAQGLFIMGFIDAASQSANLNDDEFIDLFKAVFTDLDYEYDESYRAKIILFHQSIDVNHGAFPAIIKGGDLYNKFANGNSMAPLAASLLIEELVSDNNFPASVDEL